MYTSDILPRSFFFPALCSLLKEEKAIYKPPQLDETLHLYP